MCQVKKSIFIIFLISFTAKGVTTSSDTLIESVKPNCVKKSNSNLIIKRFVFKNRVGSDVEGYFSYKSEGLEELPVIVYFQGWRGLGERSQCSFIKDFYIPFTEKGYVFVMINYPLIGKTQGKDEWGRRDIFDFLDLKTKAIDKNLIFSSNKVYLFGASRGGMIALRAVQ